MPWIVDIPHYGEGDDEEWIAVAEFKTKREAIEYAQRVYGADAQGRLMLISQVNNL